MTCSLSTILGAKVEPWVLGMCSACSERQDVGQGSPDLPKGDLKTSKNECMWKYGANLSESTCMKSEKLQESVKQKKNEAHEVSRRNDNS